MSEVALWISSAIVLTHSISKLPLGKADDVLCDSSPPATTSTTSRNSIVFNIVPGADTYGFPAPSPFFIQNFVIIPGESFEEADVVKVFATEFNTSASTGLLEIVQEVEVSGGRVGEPLDLGLAMNFEISSLERRGFIIQLMNHRLSLDTRIPAQNLHFGGLFRTLHVYQLEVPGEFFLHFTGQICWSTEAVSHTPTASPTQAPSVVPSVDPDFVSTSAPTLVDQRGSKEVGEQQFQALEMGSNTQDAPSVPRGEREPL